MAELLLFVLGLVVSALLVVLGRRKWRGLAIVVAVALMSLPYWGWRYWWRPDAPYAHYYTEGSPAGMVMVLGEMGLAAGAFLVGVMILTAQLFAGAGDAGAKARARVPAKAWRPMLAVVVVLMVAILAVRAGWFTGRAPPAQASILGSGLHGARSDLSAADAAALEEAIARIERDTGVPFAVELVKSLPSRDPHAHAAQRLLLWRGGTLDPQNGLLLVVVLDDRRAALAYGYTLDKVLRNRDEEIEHQLASDLKTMDAGQALRIAVNQVGEHVRQGGVSAQ